MPDTMKFVDHIDYQLLFESTPELHLVLLPNLTIADVSDAYLAATMTKREAITGRDIFEVFPDNPNDSGGHEVVNLRTSLTYVLERKTPHRMAVQKYNIRRPDGSSEELFWALMNNPVVNTNGEIICIMISVVDVTTQELERKEGEATAKKTQLILQNYIESLKDYLAFSIDRQYRILNFNSAFKEATARGYGTTIELEVDILDCITSATDKEKAKGNFDLALRGKKHVAIEEYGSQERRYFETSYTPIVDDQGGITGVSVLTCNMTERKKSELEVVRLTSIINSTVDSVITKTLDGVITGWNQGAQRLFGYSESDAVGKHDSLIIPKEKEKEEVEVINRIAAGEVLEHFETRRIRKDGELIEVSLSISPIRDERGVVTGVSKIARDITERKRAEENIRAMRQLEGARQAAELANRTKSQFLANMSHEIRTPLNAVIGLSHLLLKTNLTPKQADYLKKIESSSDSLLSIINDILDFSKIESGRLTLEETNFDLETIFQKLANVITYKANAKGLEIAFGVDNHVPTYLIGDPTRLEQILINLCSNAVKFTDHGEIVVSTKLAEDLGDRIKLAFEVRDTGIGMDRAQISKLFQPFTQADDTISRKYGGTGLGLSIIKRLVELMDGSVGVASEPGKGSRFHFDVWLRKQTHQRKMPIPSLDLRKMGVLLVDDNPSAREILREALTSLSFQVTAVSSGIQAIHYLKNNYHHNPVKLILMDWKMPEMDGLEAARIIREDSQLGDIRIMMMCTSYANDELYQAVDEVGLTGILIKPIRYSELYDSIMGALENGISSATPDVQKVRPEALHRGNILLVEDNEINQLVAVELLRSFGFTTEVANNGIEALEKMQLSLVRNNVYDLVLMDLQMPVMGGSTATIEIRKREEFKNLPIIAMTADAMTSVRDECLAIGMNDFITKPIDPNVMLETIEKWLTKSTGTITSQAESQGTNEPGAGINMEEGISRLGGNRKLYADILSKFSANYQPFVSQLKEKIQAGESDESQRMVHTLKGLSASLGMTGLHERCKDVEVSLANDKSQSLNGSLQPLSEELNKVLASIQTISH